MQTLAKYPFDEKFNATVMNLPEYKGEAWRYLIRFPQYLDEPVFGALAEAQFLREHRGHDALFDTLLCLRAEDSGSASAFTVGSCFTEAATISHGLTSSPRAHRACPALKA